MILGFSTGALYKANIEQNSNAAISLIQNCGANALEIGCLKALELSEVLHLEQKRVQLFEYLSLHAPVIDFFYKENDETYFVLNQIKKIHEKFNFDNIVFHPDKILNWNIFNKFNTLPISIENLNSRKQDGKTVKQMSYILGNNNFGMVLDLQHSFSVDPTCELSKDLYNKFKSRIVEIHISGQTQVPGEHTPLFKSKQIEIVRSVKNLDLPIIIESPVDNIKDLEIEFQYIKNLIKIDK